MMRYLNIYYLLFLTRLQVLLAFRLNTFVHFLHGPAYMGVLFMVQQLAYQRAPELGSWNRTESTLLLSVCFIMYTIAFILYIVALRSFLWDGIRHGVVDQYLTKPISPIFFIAWGKPDLTQLPLLGLCIALFLHQASQVHEQLSLTNSLLALCVVSLGLLVHYFALTTYATLGFVMTRAEQILELFDKTSDSGQYPISIFPGSLQFVLIAIVPVAFLGYVPTLFLLGHRPWQLVFYECVLLCIFYVLHRYAWKYALRAYTSVSS